MNKPIIIAVDQTMIIMSLITMKKAAICHTFQGAVIVAVAVEEAAIVVHIPVSIHLLLVHVTQSNVIS